jgi:hypothetical protein
VKLFHFVELENSLLAKLSELLFSSFTIFSRFIGINAFTNQPLTGLYESVCLLVLLSESSVVQLHQKFKHGCKN